MSRVHYRLVPVLRKVSPIANWYAKYIETPDNDNYFNFIIIIIIFTIITIIIIIGAKSPSFSYLKPAKGTSFGLNVPV